MQKKYRWGLRLLTIGYCIYMIFFAKIYQFMALNVFLAYIPIEISFHLKKVNSKFFVILSVLWLLFYPNAPYLFTDFFHLELLPIYQGMDYIFGLSLSGWLSFSLLAIGICAWGLIGMNTLFTVFSEFRKRQLIKKNWYQAVLFLAVNLLSSLAIFVGRFDRLHSVHLFTQPINTLKIIFFDWSIEKLGFILILTGFQLVLLMAINGIKTDSC